jgi:predicted transcriptional regulator
MEVFLLGQNDVIQLLEKANKPLSRKEIAEALGWRETKVTDIICKLLQYNEVKCQELTHEYALKFYGCKRKMRIYFV